MEEQIEVKEVDNVVVHFSGDSGCPARLANGCEWLSGACWCRQGIYTGRPL